VWLGILILIFLNTFRVMIFQVSSVVSFVYMDSVLLWIALIFVMYLRWNIGDVLRNLSNEMVYREMSSLTQHEKHEEEEEHDEAERDEEEARHHENKRIMGGGCFSRKASNQQRMFPMQSPSNVVHGIQFALLLTSISIPLYLDDLTQVLQDRPSAKILSELSMFVPPLIMMIFGVPHIIPKFVIATSVASMSRHSQIRATFLKLKRAEEEKSGKAHHHHYSKHGGGGHSGGDEEHGHGGGGGHEEPSVHDAEHGAVGGHEEHEHDEHEALVHEEHKDD